MERALRAALLIIARSVRDRSYEVNGSDHTDKAAEWHDVATFIEGLGT